MQVIKHNRDTNIFLFKPEKTSLILFWHAECNEASQRPPYMFFLGDTKSEEPIRRKAYLISNS